MQVALEVLRYVDVIEIEGSDPAYAGAELSAKLSGSIPERDFVPEDVTYSWSVNGGAATPGIIDYVVQDSDTGSVTVTASYDGNGQPSNSFTLTSAPRLISNADLPDDFSWEVYGFTPESDPQRVGQTLTVDHRSIDTATESVEYQWYRLDVPGAQMVTGNLISGVQGSSYTPVADDIGHYIGVKAILTLTGVTEPFADRAVTREMISAQPASGAVDLSAQITPAAIYEDSVLDYIPVLTVGDTQFTDAEAKDELIATWSYADNRDAFERDEDTEFAAGTPDLTNLAGRYIGLTLVYDADGSQETSYQIVSATTVQSGNAPADHDSWYSVIDLAPKASDGSAIINSKGILTGAGTESVGEDDLDSSGNPAYIVTYHYVSHLSQHTPFDSIELMLAQYPATTKVTVSAEQSRPDGSDARELNPQTFDMTTDPLYEAIRDVPAPVLAFDEALHPDDTVILANATQIAAAVQAAQAALDAALGKSDTLDVAYEWQRSTDGGATWPDAFALDDYAALTSDLLNTELGMSFTAGDRYRLVLRLTNSASGESNEMDSNVTGAVEPAGATNYGSDLINFPVPRVALMPLSRRSSPVMAWM